MRDAGTGEGFGKDVAGIKEGELLEAGRAEFVEDLLHAEDGDFHVLEISDGVAEVAGALEAGAVGGLVEFFGVVFVAGVIDLVVVADDEIPDGDELSGGVGGLLLGVAHDIQVVGGAVDFPAVTMADELDDGGAGSELGL